MLDARRTLAPVFEREHLSVTFINALFTRCSLNHGERKNGVNILVLAEDFGLFPLGYRLNDVDKMLMTYMSRGLCSDCKENFYNSTIKTNSPTKNWAKYVNRYLLLEI